VGERTTYLGGFPAQPLHAPKIFPSTHFWRHVELMVWFWWGVVDGGSESVLFQRRVFLLLNPSCFLLRVSGSSSGPE
jgi:hypothetical protein